MIAVAGRLQTRKWTNPAGVELKLTEVVANKVDFIRGPKPVEEPATF
jgi:single-stranded DNA-binding protein